VNFQNTNDPRALAANQRMLTWGRGDVLNQQAYDQASASQTLANQYLGSIDPTINQMIAGGGGYTPGEVSNITAPTQGTVQNLQGRLDAAVDPNALRQDPGLRGQLSDVIGTEAATTAAAIDPTNLELSGQFRDNYLMTPQQQQDIITKAGITAGGKDYQAVSDLERQAAAAGTDPLGVAASRQRYERQAAADASDAETSARIQASNAAAQRQAEMEQMRLGSEQYITGQEVGTAQTQAQQGLQSDMAAEANRQAAEQYLTGAKLQTATTGGEAAIQQGEFNTGVQTGIANTRLNQQNTGLQARGAEQAQQQGAAQSDLARQQQTYGVQAGSAGTAAGLGLQASQTPSTWDKIMGGISGGLSAVGGFLGEGKVVTEPTLATVGDKGPEAIVPLSRGPAASSRKPANQRPPVIPIRQRRAYGQAA
jgi:DNA-binding transcriptional regulator YdaS (Cro superfamily)